MDFARLERLGWTKKEMHHVRTILRKAERDKDAGVKLLEHALHWLLVALLTLTGIAFVVELLPVVLLFPLTVSIPLLLLAGTCIGLLFTHTIHDLRLGWAHHHASAATLMLGTLAAVGFILATLPGRIAFTQPASTAAILAVAFVSGILVTYVAHWRITREFA